MFYTIFQYTPTSSFQRPVETFWCRFFAPWFLRVGKQKLAWLFTVKWKKLKAGFFLSFFSFLWRDYIVLFCFPFPPGNFDLGLTDGKKKTSRHFLILPSRTKLPSFGSELSKNMVQKRFVCDDKIFLQHSPLQTTPSPQTHT